MIKLACAVGAALAVAGCSVGEGQDADSPPPLVALDSLPAGCPAATIRPSETVTFVAGGRAWALEPRSGRLGCLFSVREAGPLEWGPRADRALLARLEVKAYGDAPTRPPGTVDPVASSWGRPTGKSIVFVAPGGRSLLKVHPGGAGTIDVTPLADARYERVTYHPSGLAFAFVARHDGREELWVSSNVGKNARLLVHGRLHTGFDAIAFGERGTVLYFAAQHADRRVDVHRLPLGRNSAPVVWRGGPEERVTDLHPGKRAEIAFTAGRSCESSYAVAVTARHKKGVELLPDEDQSRALGWLDDRHVLVATGGCGTKLDLYSVATASLDARLLVQGVDAASVRRAEPLPPPPLAPEVLNARSSFA